MPLHHFCQCVLQRLPIERSAQANRHRHVVSDILRIELVQKPKPLLSERERVDLVAIDRHHGRNDGRLLLFLPAKFFENQLPLFRRQRFE